MPGVSPKVRLAARVFCPRRPFGGGLMGDLSPETRAAIEDGLRRIPPAARRVPAGARAISIDAIWCPRRRRLIEKDPDRRGWHNNSLEFGTLGRSVRPAELRRIEAALARGDTYRAIAKRLNRDPGTISNIARRLGHARPPAPPVDHDGIAAALLKGGSVADVARAFGVRGPTVRRVAARRGIALPDRSSSAKALALTRRIIDAADGDRTAQEIADLLGISVETVHVRRRAHDLPIPRAGQRGCA